MFQQQGRTMQHDDLRASPFVQSQYTNNTFNPQRITSKPMVSSDSLLLFTHNLISFPCSIYRALMVSQNRRKRRRGLFFHTRGTPRRCGIPSRPRTPKRCCGRLARPSALCGRTCPTLSGKNTSWSSKTKRYWLSSNGPGLDNI